MYLAGVDGVVELSGKHLGQGDRHTEGHNGDDEGILQGGEHVLRFGGTDSGRAVWVREGGGGGGGGGGGRGVCG